MKLFVAEYRAVDAPPLLFIHGHGGGYHHQRCQAEVGVPLRLLEVREVAGTLEGDDPAGRHVVAAGLD